MQAREPHSSPEFDLVLACVRWPFAPAQASLIRKLAQQPLRWAHVLKIAHHHQVMPLLARNLEACAADCVPPESLARLRTNAVENARLCFQGISELAALNRLFVSQQMDYRVFKGAPLAICAFGDATLRGIGDIDLLVRPADIPNADAILQSQGYRRLEPEAWSTPRRMRSYLAHQKDFSYENPQTGAMIDLHWRLFRNPGLPTNAGVGDIGLAWVQLGPQRLPTFPFDRLLLYLSVHGALDGWLRLKWLADIGALLRQTPAEELDDIVQTARREQILPQLSAAFLLCRQRLGFDRVPAECLGAENPSVARILRFGNRLMASNDYCPERYRISSGAWFRNELFLSPSFSYRLELIERSLFRPRLWRTMPLPDALFPFYVVLSPLEWVAFRVERVIRALRSRMAAWRRSPTVLPRFFGLDPSDLALLIEAGCMLAFFRAALKLVPVERLTARMQSARRKPQPGAADAEMDIERMDGKSLQTIRRIEWALGALVRHAPLSFVCFPQSFAAYFMLRRRHIPSKMFYGVAREQQELKAHTWIKVGERTVVGGEVEAEFTVLAVFP